MADTRHATMLALLQRLMPPPAPSAGWGAARQQIEAEAIGVIADDAMQSAVLQMSLSARSTKVSGDWDGDEYGWAFEVERLFVDDATQAPIGASGPWLDQWGATCAVPRMVGETDASYAVRIISTLVRPSNTNHGMAKVLDESLGITGTIVLEALEYYGRQRYNEGHRCNDGVRTNWSSDLSAEAEWATFVVILPVAPTTAQRLAIPQIVNRLKAAGTRLYRILGMAPALLPVDPSPPASVSLVVSDDSPTGSPTTLTVAQPEAQPEGVILV